MQVISLSELERKADGATQGEWQAAGSYVRTPMTGNGGGWAIAECNFKTMPGPENAAYIASAHPLAVKKLVEAVRAAKRYVEWDHFDGPPDDLFDVLRSSLSGIGE